MSSIIWFLIIAAALIAFIVFIIAAGKSESKDDSKNYNPPEYKPPVRNIPPQQNQIESIPIMTNHASQRMTERLGVNGYKQSELMNNAFKYGKTSDRAMGDLKAKLQSAEQNYDEETVAKFYGNSIYIFTAEDNILKTVYPFDSNNMYH